MFGFDFRFICCSVLSGSNRLFESRPPYKWRIMILTLCLVAIIIKNWRFIFI